MVERGPYTSSWRSRVSERVETWQAHFSKGKKAKRTQSEPATEQAAASPDWNWEEDIFGPPEEGEMSAEADTAQAQATFTEADPADTYEAQKIRFEAARESFTVFQSLLTSLIGSSGFASCCAGIVHFHGSAMGMGLGLGDGHSEDEHDHHHHSHFSTPLRRPPTGIATPKPAKVPSRPAPQSRRPAYQPSGASISLGTLVASFASPDILTAA